MDAVGRDQELRASVAGRRALQLLAEDVLEKLVAARRVRVDLPRVPQMNETLFGDE